MYTPEEIQASVERLLRGSIRRPVDTLGVRRTDISFSDIQEAAAGVFLLYPMAPFYVAFLGAQRLGDAIVTESALLQRILEAIDAAGRRVLPAPDVSSLFNAKAALEELETAAAARDRAFKDIARVPAFQRFNANAQAFLEGPASSVRQGGDIVQTPEEARRALPALIQRLKDAHAALVARVAALANALVDYESVNLPALVARGVISRSRAVLADHASTLDALPQAERPEKMRAVALDVLASRAVVRTFGSLGGATSALALSGIAAPYADAAHPATPASLTSDAADAFTVLAGQNALELLVDGSTTPVTIALPPSPVATLDGNVSESDGAPQGFLIGDGTNPAPPVGSAAPMNNALAITVTEPAAGVLTTTTYRASLAVSASFTAHRSAQAICDDINAVLPASVRATPFFFPLRYAGPLDIAPAGASATASVPGAVTSNFVDLGVKVGDVVLIATGPNAGLYPIAAVAPGQLTLTSASGAFVQEAGAKCSVGPAARRIRIQMTNPAAQVPARASLAVVSLDATSQNGAATLGFFPGLVSRCARTAADDVVRTITAQTSLVTAAAAFMGDGTLQGRTNLTKPLQVALFTWSGQADATFVGATLTLRGAFDPSRTRAGDVLVLRSGPQPNLAATITSVSATTLVATPNAPGTNATGVFFDAGPALVAREGRTLRIAGGPNDGDYLVEGPGDTALDVLLKRVPPSTSQGARPVGFTASLGAKRVVFGARARTTAARIAVQGPTAQLFFATAPAVAVGASAFVALPEIPRGLVPGDVLDHYTTDGTAPDATFVIQGLESSGIVRVTPDVPLGTTFIFGESPPPFARLRATVTIDFGALEERLRAWLALPVNQASYGREIDRRINPLLASESTPPFVVADAKNALQGLGAVLAQDFAAALLQDAGRTLAYALGQYKVAPVPAVDTLLQTFKEKGSDRATDLLLQGAFTTFFGLTVDEASYAGAMQAAMRDVARSDLPVRKTGRLDAQTRDKVATTVDSPDFEFDRSDVDAGAQVDPSDAPG